MHYFHLQCPLCSKAFLNNSFLQSHIQRRHGDFSPAGKENVSPETGLVPSQKSGKIDTALEEQLLEIKERLKQTESQLNHERKARKQIEKQVK